MIPHERSLVAKLSEKPFVLVGVNSDKSKEALKAALEKAIEALVEETEKGSPHTTK